MMQILIAATGGVIAAAIFLFWTSRMNARPQIALYATGLFVAALLYVAFSLFFGGGEHLKREAIGLLVYTAVAFYGFSRPLVLSLGWASHAAWDLFHPAAAYVPSWYPPACIAFDLVVAAYIIFKLLKD